VTTDAIPPRQQRKTMLVEHSREPVAVRGEDLAPILWRGRQWAVTEYGIECLDGTYAIEAGRISEDLTRHGWPQHMGEKTWIDIEDFITAWLVGLPLHGHHPDRATIFAAVARAHPGRKHA
jgi:hypothetical protein